MDDAKWGRLLGQIAERKVVPVVGTHLVDGVGGERGLQRELALALIARYADDFDPATLPGGGELNAAVCWLKHRPKVRLQRLYDDVNELLESMTADPAPMPPALRQLAAIRHFDLLVTATPDGLLERCLRERGAALQAIVHSPNRALAPPSESDLPEGYAPGLPTYLLYLFGKRCFGPEFVIHDEDVLEYAHNLIARGPNVPDRFLGALRDRNLLFLGCRFPDWLARFLVRATNKKRLSEGRLKREWIVESLQEEGSLTLFLQSHSEDTELLSDMAPEVFVAELHRRWTERYGATPVAETAAQAPVRGNGEPPLFFVSYSRGDIAAAEALVQSLRSLGVPDSGIWFDRSELKPGDAFASHIEQAIGNCHYFVPLLSRGVANRDEAFVFREWTQANERLPSMARPFVLPVIVDAEFEPAQFIDTAYLPSRIWKATDFGHAPGGMPDARLAQALKERVRDIDRARGRAGGAGL